MCQDNYLSVAALELVFLVRSQLVAELRTLGYVRSRGSCDIRSVNIHSDCWPAVKGYNPQGSEALNY